jgi:hypothetical protein
MPNVKGAVLTERDKALLSFVGVARYASAEQVHRLFFEGRSKKQTYRRLAKLCTPGGRPGETAYLRRLEFRRREGTGVPVWALTSFGRSVVAPLLPWLRPPAASDIGARFLEHTLLLNEVLTALVQRLRASITAPLVALPFRWLSEDDGVLDFQIFRTELQQSFKAVLKPDAILEIPARQRRLFIEAETGTQSITTAHPGQTGAVVSKLRRYGKFFEGLAVRVAGTWYENAFPDGFAPRLLFLVHSNERRERVRRAVRSELGERGPSSHAVLTYTFAEAPSVLAPYITRGRLDPAERGPVRIVTMDAKKAGQLRDAFNELVTALNASREALLQHNALPGSLQIPLAPFSKTVAQPLRDFIEQELQAGTRLVEGAATARH